MRGTRILCLLLVTTVVTVLLPCLLHPHHTSGDNLLAHYVGLNTVDSVTAPAQPRNLAPAHGATGVSQNPTLRSSAFSGSEVGDTHAASQWQLWKDSSSLIYDGGTDFTNLTSTTIVSGRLSYSTTYWWHVRHRGSVGLWSDWSTETSFKTTGKGVGPIWIWIVVVLVAVALVGTVAYAAASRRAKRAPKSKYRITP